MEDVTPAKPYLGEGMHVVETERLVLRPFTLDDLDALAAINLDPQVMRYIVRVSLRPESTPLSD